MAATIVSGIVRCAAYSEDHSMRTGKLGRFLRTVRHLKLRQLTSRVCHRLITPRPDTRPAPPRREPSGLWCHYAARPPALHGPQEFLFLNYRRTLELPADWDNERLTKLWRYNLHYFDDLNSANAASRRDWHSRLIERWTDENPPGQGSGWEPYPLSLRIVNWIKWSLAGGRLSDDAQYSLAVQARLLTRRLEFHLLANHLWANAKAILFAGLYYSGPEAERWRRRGIDLLRTEIREQLLADGGHFELSPMYHSIVLEDLFDLIQLRRILDPTGELIPDSDVQRWRAQTAKMLHWLQVMSHPDGLPGFFNDCAHGIALSPAQLDDYARGLSLLDDAATDPLASPLLHLSESGYARLTMGDAVAIVDVARVGPDYQPGHAHADTLTFELSLGRHRVIVNSGTSCYEISPQRTWQRSTAAHNTVTLDGQDSSEVWAGFRVGRRARPFDLSIPTPGEHQVEIACSHDGYRHLSPPAVHRRTWRIRPNVLDIVDQIDGGGHQAVCRFHLHPDVLVEDEGDDGRLWRFRIAGRDVRLSIAGAAARLEPSTYHPEFGVSLKNRCLVSTFDSSVATHRWEW